MTEQMIIAVLTVLGTMGSAFAGILISNRLTIYRIEQLEKKVEKHNNLVERMTKVEIRLDNLENDDDER